MKHQELLQTIKNRRNTKQFSDKEVDKSHINLILESAIWAPYLYLCVEPDQDSDIGNYSVLTEFSPNNGIDPAVQVSVNLEVASPRRELTATAIGLGVGWSTGKISKIYNLNNILGVDPSLKIVGVLSIGYPSSIAKKTRKDYASLTKWL